MIQRFAILCFLALGTAAAQVQPTMTPQKLLVNAEPYYNAYGSDVYTGAAGRCLQNTLTVITNPANPFTVQLGVTCDGDFQPVKPTIISFGPASNLYPIPLTQCPGTGPQV